MESHPVPRRVFTAYERGEVTASVTCSQKVHVPSPTRSHKPEQLRRQTALQHDWRCVIKNQGWASPVVNDLPANARDTGWPLVWEDSTPRGTAQPRRLSKPRALEPTCPDSWAQAPWSPCSTIREAAAPRSPTLRLEKSPHATTKTRHSQE